MSERYVVKTASGSYYLIERRGRADWVIVTDNSYPIIGYVSSNMRSSGYIITDPNSFLNCHIIFATKNSQKDKLVSLKPNEVLASLPHTNYVVEIIPLKNKI